MIGFSPVLKSWAKWGRDISHSDSEKQMISSEVRDGGLTEGGWKQTRVSNEETEPKPGLWGTWLFQAVHRSPLALSLLTFQEPKQVSRWSLKSKGSNGGSVKSPCKRHGHWAGRGNEAINSVYHSNTASWLMCSTEISLSALSSINPL